MNHKEIKNRLSAKINNNENSDLDIYEVLKDDQVIDVLEKDILPKNKRN